LRPSSPANAAMKPKLKVPGSLFSLKHARF
jgi:hypothetical protein